MSIEEKFVVRLEELISQGDSLRIGDQEYENAIDEGTGNAARVGFLLQEIYHRLFFLIPTLFIGNI